MTKLMTTIHDLETGEIITREMTPEEIADVENVHAEHKAEVDLKNLQIAAQTAALAKLTALGLTTDDLKALGL